MKVINFNPIVSTLALGFSCLLFSPPSSSAQSLIGSNRPEPHLWSGTAIALATAVIEKLRLEKGVIREWTRMHESFQAFGLAAVYAKLSFLQSMGFIDKQSFQSCVGKVGLDISNPGFHRVGGGQAGRSYVQGLKGSLGLDEDTENWVFIARAEGAVSFGEESATGEFSLKLTVADGSDDRDLASWPRGVYSLAGDFSYFSNDGKTVPGKNQFWLKVKNHPAGTLVSIQGLALVVDGSDGMLEGSIVLQKTLRPFAPMPVPQVVPGRLLFQLLPTRNRQ